MITNDFAAVQFFRKKQTKNLNSKT